MAVNVVIFASGSGSNAENLVSSFSSDPEISVSAIFCNNPQALVIERAKRLAVPCILVQRQDFRHPDFLAELQKFHADYVILAGFLWKIPDYLIAAYPDRIINIHPALLPKYGGKGMYGAFVHESVLAAQEKESGITIHLVNENYDEGRLLFQKSVQIVAGDNAETLASKIHELEYRYFPKIVADYIRQKS